ncbi:LapA family protein [Rhodoferax sp.]|uniref:LapA family protein n=1 Tax=Rhodoferax sp. TaxID=50421 RepID=UPI0025FAD21E|nr:LapA family protein [Rhodoferax sp.]MCM2296916.1 LapA family protein [Rhodoferax sp.]
MKHILWLLRWIVKITIFFTLFAFALNNQEVTTVHFFFGNYWLAPMVLVVLGAFSIGVVVGVLGMAPWWWKHRHAQRGAASSPADTGPTASATPPVYADGI